MRQASLSLMLPSSQASGIPAPFGDRMMLSPHLVTVHSVVHSGVLLVAIIALFGAL